MLKEQDLFESQGVGFAYPVYSDIKKLIGNGINIDL